MLCNIKLHLEFKENKTVHCCRDVRTSSCIGSKLGRIMNDRGQHLARRSADFSVPLFLSVKRGRGRKERRGEGIQARYGKRKEGKRKGGKGDFSLLPTWKKKELSPILHTHKLITRSKLRRGGRRRRGGEGVCPGRRGREGGRKGGRQGGRSIRRNGMEKERRKGRGALEPRAQIVMLRGG